MSMNPPPVKPTASAAKPVVPAAAAQPAGSVPIKGIVVHWSASGAMTTVEQIRSWHKAHGWRDIGYHRVILHPSLVENVEGAPPQNWWELVKEGRKLNSDKYMEDYEVGAHTKGFNTGYVGVCVVGKPDLPLHPLQRAALLATLKTFGERFELPRSAVKGHQEMPNQATACPGAEILALVKDWRAGRV